MADYTLRHIYDSGCPVVVGTVTSGPPDAPQVQDFVVELTGCVDQLTAEVTASPDDPSGNTAMVTWDNATYGPVDITWDNNEVIANQPESGSLTHAYLPEEAGAHTVKVQDVNEASRVVIVNFETPLTGGGGELNLTVRADPADPTGYTVIASWDSGGGDDGPVNLAVAPDPADPTGYAVVASWDSTTA